MDIELLETPRTYVSPSSDKQNTRFTVDEETPPPSAVSVYEGPPDPFTTTAHSTVSNSHNTLDPNENFPDGGLHSWLVVLGSFFLLMASYGLMNSLGVLQSYFAENQLANYSTRDIGWIPGLFVFLALMLGVQVGPLFDRYGPKGIVLAGSCCYVASLFLLAESKTYWQFILSFGVLGGIGAALVSTSAMASVPQWFRRRAGVAMGIAMAGSGVGGTVFPFVLRAGFARWGFKWGIRLLAFLILFMCLVGSLLVKSRLPKGRAGGTVSLKCFKDPRFTWLSVGIFSMFTHLNCLFWEVLPVYLEEAKKRMLGLELQVFAGLGLYPTYIVMQGFSSNTSIILLAVLNMSGSFSFYRASQSHIANFQYQRLLRWPFPRRYRCRSLWTNKRPHFPDCLGCNIHIRHLATVRSLLARPLSIQYILWLSLRFISQPSTRLYRTDLESE